MGGWEDQCWGILWNLKLTSFILRVTWHSSLGSNWNKYTFLNSVYWWQNKDKQPCVDSVASQLLFFFFFLV